MFSRFFLILLALPRMDGNELNILIELLKTDMKGNKRVHNGTIDMGAVEFGSSK